MAPHQSQQADNLTPDELEAQAAAKAALHKQIIEKNHQPTDAETKAREAGFIDRANAAEKAARGEENA
jgi:hypothetical protein